MGLRIGMVLHGFCNGYFGRDSYNDKRIEAFGVDWIVAREDGGNVVFAIFNSVDSVDSVKEIDELVKEWRQEEDEDSDY